MVSAVAGVPAAVVVLIAVATGTIAVDVLLPTAVSNVSSIQALVGVPVVDGIPTVEHPFF
jgi:hypothetical protein